MHGMTREHRFSTVWGLPTKNCALKGPSFLVSPIYVPVIRPNRSRLDTYEARRLLRFRVAVLGLEAHSGRLLASKRVGTLLQRSGFVGEDGIHR